MEITWLKNEDNAIQYVYASAVPQKIPLDIFKEIVQSSKENCLPEFYVISEQGSCSTTSFPFIEYETE